MLAEQIVGGESAANAAHCGCNDAADQHEAHHRTNILERVAIGIVALKQHGGDEYPRHVREAVQSGSSNPAISDQIGDHVAGEAACQEH